MTNQSLQYACEAFAKTGNPNALTAPDIATAQGEALQRLIKHHGAPLEMQIGILGYPKVLVACYKNIHILIEENGHTHS